MLKNKVIGIVILTSCYNKENVTAAPTRIVAVRSKLRKDLSRAAVEIKTRAAVAVK